jgi:hypothetical protein
VEAEQPIIRLYLTLPWNAPPAQRADAAELVVRCGYARRFGALELDLDTGSLRVRVESDATEDTLEGTVTRVLDRARALAHEVSPAWRALVRDGAKASEAYKLCAGASS